MDHSPGSMSNIKGMSSGFSCPLLRSLSPVMTMKIVIAGHNGFAQFIALCIKSTTCYQLMMLTHTAQPDLEKQGWQVFATSFIDAELTYLLTGADVVISTIAGSDQIALIDAAVATGVRHFVPSEFSGLPSLRLLDDPTDDKHREALYKLHSYKAKNQLQFTVFSCGLFYERFSPHGLAGNQINMNGSLGNSSFLLNMEDAQIIVQADIPAVYVSMISARDAAQYVVAALKLQDWPREFTFCAQRLSLQDLADICERVKGVPFQQVAYDVLSLPGSIEHARLTGNRNQEVQFSQTLNVLTSRFDLGVTNLDTLVHIDCEGFEDWLRHAWA